MDNVVSGLLDTRLRNILIRQIPVILISVVTGFVAIYYLGFWLGIIINGLAWGAAVFLAKLYISLTIRNSDPFSDDRYLMYFVLALVGRNR